MKETAARLKNIEPKLPMMVDKVEKRKYSFDDDDYLVTSFIR